MGSLAFGWFVLLERFLDGDTLEFGFLFSFFPFNGFMLSKVFNILGVVVRFVGLCFRC
jgi:hypothetical protein